MDVVRRLGDLEACVMDSVWNRPGPTTVRDVLGDLNTNRQRAYTTVMTVMDNLHTKGLLRRTMAGRAWLYESVLDRGAYTAQIMRDALASAGDPSAALAHFVDGITDEESTELRNLLRRRSRD